MSFVSPLFVIPKGFDTIIHYSKSILDRYSLFIVHYSPSTPEFLPEKQKKKQRKREAPAHLHYKRILMRNRELFIIIILYNLV